jgi:hypothetical protein
MSVKAGPPGLVREPEPNGAVVDADVPSRRAGLAVDGPVDDPEPPRRRGLQIFPGPRPLRRRQRQPPRPPRRRLAPPRTPGRAEQRRPADSHAGPARVQTDRRGRFRRDLSRLAPLSTHGRAPRAAGGAASGTDGGRQRGTSDRRQAAQLDFGGGTDSRSVAPVRLFAVGRHRQNGEGAGPRSLSEH